MVVGFSWSPCFSVFVVMGSPGRRDCRFCGCGVLLSSWLWGFRGRCTFCFFVVFGFVVVVVVGFCGLSDM